MSSQSPTCDHTHHDVRSVAAHRDACVAHVRAGHRPAPVLLPVAQAVGRVLAQDAIAALPIPAFSNSAMDGFLVHAADAQPGATLPVVGDVAAGDAPLAVPQGAAVRIMTGAPVPVDGLGTDESEGHGDLQVIPVELTNIAPGPVPLPQEITLNEDLPRKSHIRARGENVSPGEVAVAAGTLLDAGALATLISSGVTQVHVLPRPRVVVVSSGNELASLQELLAGTGDAAAASQHFRIPDSNGPMIAALADATGAEVVRIDHAGDTEAEFAALLDSLAGECDLVLTTGGVSVGAFDVVRAACTAHDGQAWFDHVAQKPGGPQGLSQWNGTPIICLPGNPVAAFVSFHAFVAPALDALAGRVQQRPILRARAAADFPRASAGKLTKVPVRLDFSVSPPLATPAQRGGVGSHLIATLTGTHGIAAFSAPSPVAGEDVDIQLY